MGIYKFCGPIFPVLVHSFLEDKLDVSIGNLNLPTGLRMIRCGQLVSYGILSHKGFKRSIAKVSAIITDDSTRSSEAGKMFSFKNFMTTLLSLVLQGMASTHWTRNPQQPICIGSQMN